MSVRQMMIQLPFERRNSNGFFKCQKFNENEQYLRYTYAGDILRPCFQRKGRAVKLPRQPNFLLETF